MMPDALHETVHPDDRGPRQEAPPVPGSRGVTRGKVITPLRVLLVLLLVPALGMAVYKALPDAPPIEPADVAAAKQALRDEALRMVEAGALARPDGQVYAVDICQLATFAALSRDRELFDPLRRVILDRLLIDRGDGDEATGMVAWGYREGQPLDASGTTETLRAAEALWRGNRAFGPAYAADVGTIRLMLDAYARHQGTDRGVWMIRNYFNLGTHTYSTNSFLIDYDPDLLAELAAAFDDPRLDELARRSAELIEYALTDAGLLHQNIRPEVATIQVVPDGKPPGFYSIDGVEQLSNVLATAERCVTTNPDVARGVLTFAQERIGDLHQHYEADTGKAAYGVYGPRASTETWAPLVRLSVKLDALATAETSLRHLVHLTGDYPKRAAEDFDVKLWAIGETLLALQAWQDMKQPDR